MNYRIVIETEKSGKKWYYVQRLYLLYFWFYLRDVKDMSMHILILTLNITNYD
jgi:hypothetical protein